MHQRLLYLSSFVLLLASCQRELDVPDIFKAPDITADIQTETRTVLSVDEYGAGTIYWKPADQIDVFFGTKKASYTSQNASDATTAVFKTTDNVCGTDISSTNIWGLFPANSSSTCNGSSVTTTLPSTQYGVPGTFDKDLFLAVAHSSTTTLPFYNVCGGIKFSLYRDDITSITFRGNNNEDLAGNIRLSFVSGNPQATVVNGVKEITLTPKQGQVFVSGVNYYIVTLPVTLSRGFKMTFATTDGTIGTFNYTEASVNIKRSVFSRKYGIDSYATFGNGSDFYTSFDLGSFTFSCNGDCLQVEESDICEWLGMSKEVFEHLYPVFYTSWSGTGSSVTFDSQNGLLQWWVTAEWLWNNAIDEEDAPGAYLTTEIVFENPNNGDKVIVNLKARPPVIMAYRIPIGRYISNYWTSNYDFTLCNVRVPYLGETEFTNCVFVNNVNAPFYTNADGVIDLEGIGMEGVEASNIEYFFCKDMEDITRIGPYEVEFTVNETGDHLYATVENVTECIAVIDNESYVNDRAPNVVVLNKESDVAKLLLNTCPGLVSDEYGFSRPLPGEFYILLGANAIIGGNAAGAGFEVNLFWKDSMDGDWHDHFAAKYYQPVFVADGVVPAFIDFIDFGQGGSFIAIKDLIKLIDWRARPFDAGKDKLGTIIPDQVDGIDYFSNYWQYYGPFEIQIGTIKCNLGYNAEIVNIPATFEIHAGVSADDLKNQIYDLSRPYYERDQTDSGYTIEEMIDLLSESAGEFGFLTFKNNGTVVTKDFELYIPLRITYGWGTLEKVITIRVFRFADSSSF